MFTEKDKKDAKVLILISLIILFLQAINLLEPILNIFISEAILGIGLLVDILKIILLISIVIVMGLSTFLILPTLIKIAINEMKGKVKIKIKEEIKRLEEGKE